MRHLVVDASVVIKWFVPEVHAEAARRLLREDVELFAPDLLRAEVGNVLWKKRRSGEIDEATGRAILADLRRFPVQIVDSDTFLEAAWELAVRLDRSFYDSLYLALAHSLGYPLVTADLRLYNSLKATPNDMDLLWVEDA